MGARSGKKKTKRETMTTATTKKPHPTKKGGGTGRIVECLPKQAKGPEFKSQYWKKKKKSG
jgi:hypothetical protein